MLAGKGSRGVAAFAQGVQARRGRVVRASAIRARKASRSAAVAGKLPAYSAPALSIRFSAARQRAGQGVREGGGVGHRRVAAAEHLGAQLAGGDFGRRARGENDGVHVISSGRSHKSRPAWVVAELRFGAEPPFG